MLRPVVEACVQGAFLCSDPVDIWKKGSYNQVPILLGNTEIEGILLNIKNIKISIKILTSRWS